MGQYNRHLDHSDELLLVQLKADDQRALGAIYDRYRNKVLAVAMNRLDDIMDAEECVQDVFAGLWACRKELVIKYTLATYLSAAVKLRSITLLYRQSKRERLEHYKPEEFSLAADASFLEKELQEGIEASVKALPEKCQLVYRLSREQGRSNKDIARELSVTEKAVEKHISKALKVIRGGLTSTIPTPILICFIYNLISRLH